MKNLFSYNWLTSSENQTKDLPGVYRTPRDWQEPAFSQLKDSSYMIVNAPTGSGKSWLMCLISSYKMLNDKSLRCIISVPQTIIAPGFSSEKILIGDNIKLDWRPSHNLCEQQISKGPVRYAIEWLAKGVHDSFNDRILLCTHATLVRIYKKLKEESRLDLLARLLLWVDEAHHISIETEELANGIGKLVAFLFNNEALSAQIGLTTATLFRGDRQQLISASMAASFEKYELPLDQYLKTMKHLRSFSYDFLLCGRDYTKAIGDIVKLKKCRDIIWIPHTVSQHSSGDKYLEVEKIIQEYQDVHKGDKFVTEQGITSIQDGSKVFKILNLVDERLRETQKKFIHSEKIAIPGSLDSIITMGMFKEGANWIHANRGIIVGARSSLVDILQMLGRLLRDAEEKEHAELIHVLPFSLDQMDDTFGENLNCFVKAILVSLLLEELIQPVTIKSPQAEKKDKNLQDTQPQPLDRLTNLIPDPSVMHSLTDESVQCILDAKDEKGSINYDKYVEKMDSVFEDYNISENRELIAKKLWNLHSRRTLKMQGIDVDDVDFQIIKPTHPLGWMLRYTSDICNISTLDCLRGALQDANEKRWNKSFELIKSYFEKTNRSAIPEHLIIDGINLFHFATVQRKAFKKGKMLKERQLKLESLPLWYWDHSDSRDLEGYEALKSFVSREKHARVPTTHIENGFRLGIWLNQKKESKSELPKDQIDSFESLPGWSWNTGHDQAWEYGFSILQEYVKIYSHAQPPSGLIFMGFALSTWVKGQRDAKKRGCLTKEKSEKLESLKDWSWEVFDDRNKQGFAALDSFVARESHALVPTSHVENGFKLGRWVTLKRTAYNNPKSRHKLTKEDIQKLESYPWWYWNGDVGRWERGKYFLLKFVFRENHSRVKSSHVEDGFELGMWVGVWKHKYNNGELPQWKIDFFESLPKWSWDLKADRWMDAYDLLKQYTQRERHTNVPAKHIENGFRLGTWVRTQKYSYSVQSYGKKLSQEKIKLLESIAGWNW